LHVVAIDRIVRIVAVQCGAELRFAASIAAVRSAGAGHVMLWLQSGMILRGHIVRDRHRDARDAGACETRANGSMATPTQVMPEVAIGTPWIEGEIVAGRGSERIAVSKLPYTIGRQESTELCINSTRISREHARIVRHGKGYKIRDLGSTNGTYVNGERIDETALADGDLISIADIEFTFFSGQPRSVAEAATQRIERAEADEGSHGIEEELGSSLVQTVRWMNETVTQGGLQTTFQRLVALDGGQTFGWDVAVFDPAEANEQAAQALLAGTDCRVTRRARQVSRLGAVERIAALRVGGRTLLRIDPIELADSALADRLGKLANLLGRGRVVVDLDESVTHDARQFRAFYQAMSERDVSVCLRGFAAGRAQMAAYGECPPQFVRFASSMTSDLTTNPRRQKQIEAAIAAAGEFDAQVIVTNIVDADQAAMCRDLGCGLAVGPLYGGPHSTPQLR
jgi:EAL domain-containing protein (putative c-di-GMP-specific phosphodiesterase class I)